MGTKMGTQDGITASHTATIAQLTSTNAAHDTTIASLLTNDQRPDHHHHPTSDQRERPGFFLVHSTVAATWWLTCRPATSFLSSSPCPKQFGINGLLPEGFWALARPFTHLGRVARASAQTFRNRCPWCPRKLYVICGHYLASFSRHIAQMCPPGTANSQTRPL